ncbi:molecular chaperone [Vibrio cholerae]|uniref:molecular chaperone n=1 Tax=Vibrio cholerae TaxID=666 RepID=UPI0030801C8B
MKIDIDKSFLNREISVIDFQSSTLSNADLDNAEAKIQLVKDDSDLSYAIGMQRDALRSLLPRTNKEQEISNSLISQIDKSSIELEVIGNWTEGGLNAFKAALDMIASNIMNDGEITSSDYENLFQIIMLDVLANFKEYGFSEDKRFLQFLSWGIEYTGSGQHNSWVDRLPNPDNWDGESPNGENGSINNHLVKIDNKVWEAIAKKVKNGAIPENSLTARLMKVICGTDNKESISSTLPKNVYDNLYVKVENGHVVGTDGYYSTKTNGWITENNNEMSPLMRLTLLSHLLKENPELSKSTLDIILFSDLKTINDTFMKEYPSKADNVYDYIIKADNTAKGDLNSDGQGWQDSSLNGDSATRPNGVVISLDFNGELNIDWLNDLSSNYPKRVLGDEDIKEINRIGDNVKMIMQTLKYWFQILRDERVAIARNI